MVQGTGHRVQGKLFFFNPDHEMAVGNGSRFYMPPANIQRMGRELAYLPAYFSEKGDGVLVQEEIDQAFLAERKQFLGLEPDLVWADDKEKIRNFHIEPWGISPRFFHLFKDVIADTWKEEYRDLYSRKTAKACLERLCEKLSFIAPSVIPDIYTSLESLSDRISSGQWIVKAPWSSSGKGLLSLPHGRIGKKEAEWINGVLAKQKYIMAERRLDKKIDFAMQFKSNGLGQVDYVCYSMFQTNAPGTYAGNEVMSQQEMEEILTAYVPKEELEQIKAELISVLQSKFSTYTGYIGVDMMIYTNGNAEYRIQPCLEINLRYNMGLLAFFLYERFLKSGSRGFFSVDYLPKGEALRLHEELAKTYPLSLSGNRIESGYLLLTPVTLNTRFLAYLKVE